MMSGGFDAQDEQITAGLVEPGLTAYRLDHQIAALRSAQRAPTNPWAIELNRADDDPEWAEPATCPCTYRTENRGGREVVIACENQTTALCERCAIECSPPTEQTGEAA